MAGARLGAVLALGMAASPALAWDARTVSDLDLAATTTSVAVLDGLDEPRVLVMGPSRVWLVHPQTGAVLASLPTGANAATSGGPGFVWLCGDAGLARLRTSHEALGEPEIVDPAPCRGVARVTSDAGHVLVAVGEQIRSWPLGADESLGAVYVLEGTVDGWPLIGVDKRRFAVGANGGTAVLEEGPWGTSSLATGGKIGGLAPGPSSWAWSVPAEDVVADVTRARRSVAKGPAALAGGDLDGNGVPDLVVAHPELDAMGLLIGGQPEVLVPAPVGVRALRAGDLDGDGCDEIVAMTAAGAVRVVDGPCGAVPATTAATGDVPGTSGRRNELLIGDSWPTLTVRSGERLDLVLVDVLGAASAWAASGGPQGLVVTSSGTVLYKARPEDVGRWRVAVRLWVNGSWARRGGFELLVLPGDGTAVAEVAERDGGDAATVARRVGADTSDLSVALDEQVGELRHPLPIRGCSLGLGGVLGGSQVTASWVLLGSNFLLSGSPAVSVSCDGGQQRGLWWSVGLDFAPWFVYVVADTELRHGMAATVSLGWTREDLFLGGFGTTGATVLGFGPVARWLPFERASGGRHGPEVRVSWTPSSELIIEGMVLYTVQLGAYR